MIDEIREVCKKIIDKEKRRLDAARNAGEDIPSINMYGSNFSIQETVKPREVKKK
jgi:hypothetical protein